MVIQFILKRLLWFIPVLFFVILLLFLFDQKSNGDQFSKLTENNRGEQLDQGQIHELQRKMAQEKGWDLPPFYLTIHHRGWSSEFYREVNARRRDILDQVGAITWDHEASQQITELIFNLHSDYRYLEKEDDFKSEFLALYRQNDIKSLWNKILTISDVNINNPNLILLHQYISSANRSRKWYHVFPKLSWHGSQNRFHHFIIDYFFSGTQKSVTDGRPIYSKIWPAAGITFFINFVALAILILIGIPLGIYLFKYSGKLRERLIHFVLYLLFALPLFWLATVVLMMAGWLPGAYLTGTLSLESGEIPSILTFLRPQNIIYLILPIFTVVLGLVAFLAIQMYRALRETNEEKYILAAKSRGLSQNYVTNIHNKPNALFSILTIIGNSIPQLISGSVVIEIIFNIPGMGRLLWNALYDYDWSLVTGILIVGVLFSILGQLLTDLAYYYFNPALRTAS